MVQRRFEAQPVVAAIAGPKNTLIRARIEDSWLRGMAGQGAHVALHEHALAAARESPPAVVGAPDTFAHRAHEDEMIGCHGSPPAY